MKYVHNNRSAQISRCKGSTTSFQKGYVLSIDNVHFRGHSFICRKGFAVQILRRDKEKSYFLNTRLLTGYWRLQKVMHEKHLSSCKKYFCELLGFREWLAIMVIGKGYQLVKFLTCTHIPIIIIKCDCRHLNFVEEEMESLLNGWRILKLWHHIHPPLHNTKCMVTRKNVNKGQPQRY